MWGTEEGEVGLIGCRKRNLAVSICHSRAPRADSSFPTCLLLPISIFPLFHSPSFTRPSSANLVIRGSKPLSYQCFLWKSSIPSANSERLALDCTPFLSPYVQFLIWREYGIYIYMNGTIARRMGRIDFQVSSMTRLFLFWPRANTRKARDRED